MALALLVGSVTQGSADAFAEAEIATALAGTARQSYRVGFIEFEFSNFAALTSTYEMCLTRRTKAAMPVITDRDVIQKFTFRNFLTTSGGASSPLIRRFDFTEDEDLRIVEDPLYVQIDSNGSSLTLTGYVRVGYTVVSISEVDKLTILTQSLVT